MSFFNNIKLYLYYSLSILLYLSYIAIFLGIYIINPEYLHSAIVALEFFICAVLIIRFHPFQKAKIEKYDQHLIFLSASIILTNIGITNYILSKVKTTVKNHLSI